MAQDLQGAVATRVPRPLEEERQRRRSVIVPHRTGNLLEAKYMAGKLSQGAVSREATDEASEDGSPTTPDTPVPTCCRVMSHSLAEQRQPRSVSFVSSAEVPMILPKHLLGARHVPRKRAALLQRAPRSRELRAQASTERPADNQQRVGKAVASALQLLSNCFAGMALMSGEGRYS